MPEREDSYQHDSIVLCTTLFPSFYPLTGFIQANMSKIQGLSRTSKDLSNSFQGLKVNAKYSSK